MLVSYNEETREVTVKFVAGDPTPSKTKQATGKGMDLVATTGGFIVTGTRINGKPLRLSLNAGI